MPQAGLNLTLDQRSAVPLYEQICQQIRRQIESQQLRPGMPLPTNHELRARLQVNYKTAQQAMATLAREGYVTRQARRGTVVRGVPRRGVVGIYTYMNLVSPEWRHEFYRLITGHLSQLLEREGRVHRMYLGSESEGANMASEDLLRHLGGGGLCGVLLVNTPWRYGDEIVKQSRAMRIPVVALSGYADVDYSVRIDFPGYVRNAVQFLREQGRERIGVIYNRSSPSFRDSGVIPQILQECGVEPNPARIIGRIETEQGGYGAASDLPLGELDGLIVQDDIMATGVDRRLCEIGTRVPEDLRVVTLWNHGSRLRLMRAFERFEVDIAKQVRLGLKLMQDAISGQRIFEPHLKIIPEYAGQDGDARVSAGKS